MIIDQFLIALKDKKPTDDLKQSAMSLLNADQNKDCVLAAQAAIYLHQFYAAEGGYDKIIIDHYINREGCGLTYNENPSLFLELSKILARLFFKYGKYRQAGNFILFISANTDEDCWPDWLTNYRVKIELHTDPEFCFLCPDKLLSKIPIGETKDKQRIAIYKDFLQQGCGYHAGKDKQVTAAFIEKVSPFVAAHVELFVDEWNSLSNLITEIKSAPLKEMDAETVRKMNSILQVDIARLNQELQIRDAQIEGLREQIRQVLSQPTSGGMEQSQSVLLESKRLDSPQEIEYEPKILILGASMLSDTEIVKTIENHFGLSRKSIVIESDYQKNKRFDVASLQYNSQYDGILVGPVAHSVCGKGDNSSLVQTLKEEGFPPSVEIRTQSGTLKITKTSLKDAMAKLLNTIQTITPTDVCA